MARNEFIAQQAAAANAAQDRGDTAALIRTCVNAVSEGPGTYDDNAKQLGDARKEQRCR